MLQMPVAKPMRPLPSDEERALEIAGPHLHGAYNLDFTGRECGVPDCSWKKRVQAIVALLAQVRAEASQEALACQDCKEYRAQVAKASQEKDAEIGRLKAIIEIHEMALTALRRSDFNVYKALTGYFGSNLRGDQHQLHEALSGHINALKERAEAAEQANAALRERVRVLEDGLRLATQGRCCHRDPRTQADCEYGGHCADLEKAEALLAPASARCGRKFQDKHWRRAICIKGKGHAADCVGSPPPESEPAKIMEQARQSIMERYLPERDPEPAKIGHTFVPCGCYVESHATHPCALAELALCHHLDCARPESEHEPAEPQRHHETHAAFGIYRLCTCGASWPCALAEPAPEKER